MHIFYSFISLLVVPYLVFPASCFGMEKISRELLLMGSAFEITAVAEDAQKANLAIDVAIKEIQRIENRISSWRTGSETWEINQASGQQAVKVSWELYSLISRCVKISELTDGIFDISYAALDKVWDFSQAVHNLPDKKQLDTLLPLVDYRKIKLNSEDTSVFLEQKGMKIGFGAIGKGYAANRAALVMQEAGITAGIVNAGGDLFAWGKNTNGNSWKIGIADPDNKNKSVGWLELEKGAIVTSGNYEKFFWVDSVLYAHIIDPRTGYPARGIKSATVICPDAELADALATTIFILGKTEGIALINQLNGIEGFLIDDENRMITSHNLRLNLYEDQKSECQK